MIELTVPQTEKLEKLLSGIPGAAPKAASRAINRALESAKAEAVRAVRQEYTVRATDVRKTITITKSTPESLEGRVTSTGQVIALSKFQISPSKPVKRHKSPVKAQVKREGGRKPLGRAFVAKMNSGHIGVFTRKTAKRFPIEQLYGPSIPQMLGSETVTGFVEEKAMETLDKRLEHEISRVMEGN